MTAVEKFLFHTNFDEPPAPATPIEPDEDLPPPPSFSEEELEAARQQALAAGQAQGREEALRGLEQSCADGLEKLSAQLDQLGRQVDQQLQTISSEGLSAAVTVVRKLFPALARREELREIEAVVKDCLQRLHQEPRIVVRLSEGMLDRFKERIDQIAAKTGFEGRLVLLSEPDFQPSDVKVEWADGGAERSTARTWSEIESRLRHCISPSQQPDSIDPTPDESAPVETEGYPQ